MQNFQALRGSAPRPPCFQRRGAPPPDPQDSPHCEFLATRLGVRLSAGPTKIREKMRSSFGKNFFFGLHLNSGKKSVPFLAKTFFLVFT